LREAAESADGPAVDAALEAVGLGGGDRGWFDEVHERTKVWHGLARDAMQEAVDASRTRDAPLVLHHTPGSFDIVLEAAKALGDRVIAGHSNFQTDDPDEAVARARALREHGAWIDIMSGDAFSARRFHSTPAVTFRLLQEGLVDLVSTDYAGGFWDPMLYMLERAHQAGVVTLPAAVKMVTSAAAEAIPRLAPLRGTVAEGFVADLVVTQPGRLSAIRHVLVSGAIVGPASGRW
jgi:alpha-D-ribose 1-methylphosphonate 5-triphosphate diphosphatase PhnM